MAKAVVWVRNGLALAGVLSIGFWFGSARAVKASSPGSSHSSGQGVQFQISEGNQASSTLLVYTPDDKTVYVYPGAMQGNSMLQCSYKFQMGEPGDAIRRLPCGVHEMLP